MSSIDPIPIPVLLYGHLERHCACPCNILLLPIDDTLLPCLWVTVEYHRDGNRIYGTSIVPQVTVIGAMGDSVPWGQVTSVPWGRVTVERHMNMDWNRVFVSQ